MQIKDKYTHIFRFSQSDVNNFAKLTGDINPIHLNKEYAKKTLFKRRIMHGFLSASIFSKVFGTLFPKEGCIYLEQNLKFLHPMYCDTSYVAEFEIIDIKNTILNTNIKTDQITTIKGTAVIKI